MSATLKTPNYELPYYAGEDYLNPTDYNNAMIKIDEVMHENAGTGETQEAQITELTQNVSSLTTQQESMLNTLTDNTSDIKGLTTRQENLETHMNDVDENINGLKQGIASTNAAVQKNARDITAVNNTANAAVDTANEAVSTANSASEKVDQTSTLVGEQGTEITSIQTSIGKLTESVTTLETEMENALGDIASVEADVGTNSNNITKISSAHIWAQQINNYKIQSSFYSQTSAGTTVTASVQVPNNFQILETYELVYIRISYEGVSAQDYYANATAVGGLTFNMNLPIYCYGNSIFIEGIIPIFLAASTTPYFRFTIKKHDNTLPSLTFDPSSSWMIPIKVKSPI